MRFSLPKILLIALGVVCLILLVELYFLLKLGVFPFFKKKEIISVVSDVPGFSVQLKDKKRLNQYIETFRLFKEGQVKIRGTSGYQTIEDIVIHLTGTSRQDFFDKHLDKTGKIYYSVGAEIRNGKLHLLVFIEPSLYEQKGSEDFSRRFSVLAVRGLFLTSKTSYEMDEKEKEEKRIALTQEIFGSNSLFTIKKTK